MQDPRISKENAGPNPQDLRAFYEMWVLWVRTHVCRFRLDPSPSRIHDTCSTPPDAMHVQRAGNHRCVLADRFSRVICIGARVVQEPDRRRRSWSR